MKVVKEKGLCKLIVGIDVMNPSPKSITVAQYQQNYWYSSIPQVRTIPYHDVI